MKVIITFLLLTINLFAAENFLIPDSNSRKLELSELQTKTLDFLIYSRNEIFARNGYIFDDADFDYFFRNMTWYEKKSKNVELNETEKFNVNLIQKIELQKKEKTQKQPNEILFRFCFNNMPLYYLRQNGRNGNFVLLDSIYIWTLALKNIPFEFIDKNKLYKTENIEENYAPITDRSKIKIIDIENKRHDNDSYEEEIIVKNYSGGEGDDPLFCILGFDKKGVFRKIFSGHGNLQKIEGYNNYLEVTTSIDTKMPSLNKIPLRWLWNRNKETVHRIPLILEESPGISTLTCKEKVTLYSDPISAYERNEKAIVGYTHVKGRFKVGKYFFSKDMDKVSWNPTFLYLEPIVKAIFIYQSTFKGWIKSSDLKKFNYIAGSG